MSAGELPLVSVVVPALNGEPTLGDCLSSLLRLDYPETRREILVVDNGSTDRTAEIARGFGVGCVREPRRGVASARNRGIEAAAGELVAFTDCDCTAATGWLSELVSGFGENGAGAVAGEVVSFPPRTAAERYAAVRKPFWAEWTRERERPWFLFGSAAVRREALDEVGPFDPAIRGGGEDIDWSWRFFRLGLELVRRPRAVVFHRHRRSGRELFLQHLGYGRGQAALLRKHGDLLSWGWRAEAAAWADAGASAWRLLAGAAGVGRAPEQDLAYASLDLVRKLAQRTGFLYGLLDGALRPAPRPPVGVARPQRGERG